MSKHDYASDTQPTTERRQPPVDHPTWQAALRAPVEPETQEEREAVAAAMNSGPLIPGEQVTAELERRRLAAKDAT